MYFCKQCGTQMVGMQPFFLSPPIHKFFGLIRRSQIPKFLCARASSQIANLQICYDYPANHKYAEFPRSSSPLMVNPHIFQLMIREHKFLDLQFADLFCQCPPLALKKWLRFYFRLTFSLKCHTHIKEYF